MKLICPNCLRVFEQQPFEDWPPIICECGGEEFKDEAEYDADMFVNIHDNFLEDEKLFKENENGMANNPRN